MAQLSFLRYLSGIYKLNLEKSIEVHQAIIQAIYDCFIMTKQDIDVMKLELCLSTASGIWLDYWGDFFSVYRKSKETDDAYSKRIIATVIQPKSTIPAIKDHIASFLNTKYNTQYTREDIDIKEPWMKVAKYSHKGTLSNTARFFSNNYYCHAVMDISVPEKITDDLIELVKAVKAAGVKVIWSVSSEFDIVTGFNDKNDAWAVYSRYIELMTKRSTHNGLTLSASSISPTLSGKRETWRLTTSFYEWYALFSKNTDDSIIITKKDLIGLLDYYKELEEVVVIDTQDNFRVSDDGILSSSKLLDGSKSLTEYLEHLIKITDEDLESLKLLDRFLSLSSLGKLSTTNGTLLDKDDVWELWNKLMNALEDFKNQNPEYYNSVQPPIFNGEKADWLVAKNENWLFDSPVYCLEDLEQIYEQHCMEFGINFEEFVSLSNIMKYEEWFTSGGYSSPENFQPLIEVKTETE